MDSNNSNELVPVTEEEEVLAENDFGSEPEMDGDELVVLHPTHPLMGRFQAALATHLGKQKEQIEMELRETSETLKKLQERRETIGVELYSVQQELARSQMNLERMHDDQARLANERSSVERTLEDSRQEYKRKLNHCNEEKKKHADLKQQLDKLHTKLFYINNAKIDVDSDIAVMRRVAEKATKELDRSEIEKQRQDHYVHRLTERVDLLNQEITLIDAETVAQSDEAEQVKTAAREAQAEIETIQMEKRKLVSQWQSSLVGMQRRDEALAAMQDAMNQQQQEILTLDTQIDSYKKSIQKEQEHNEKLTMVNNKVEHEIRQTESKISDCRQRFDTLNGQYATCIKILQQTEQQLKEATVDMTTKKSELDALRKEVEKVYRDKLEVEDNILSYLREKLQNDKAAQHSIRLTEKRRANTRHLDQQVVGVENATARNQIEAAEATMRADMLKKELLEQEKLYNEKSKAIDKSQNEIKKRVFTIEQRQQQIDLYNKKITEKVESQGGEELGPYEIKIKSLMKSIQERQAANTQLEQEWLRDQHEMVKLTRERQEKLDEVQKIRNDLVIAEQRKIRTEAQVERMQADISAVRKRTEQLRNEIITLNKLLVREGQAHESLEKSNLLNEKDYQLQLREDEQEKLQLDDKLNQINADKEQLKQDLVEVEKQIMLWEKKTQIAKETKAAVDMEFGQGEVKSMRTEIHRMEVTLAKLKRHQEELVQEMEKAVSRRETIYTRGEAQVKSKRPVVTKGDMQRTLAELRRKIKETAAETIGIENRMQQTRDQQAETGRQLGEHRINVETKRFQLEQFDSQLAQLSEQKDRNLQELVLLQQKGNYYDKAKKGKYSRLARSQQALEGQRETQEAKTIKLHATLTRIVQEYPQLQATFRPIIFSLQRRVTTDTDSVTLPETA